MSTCSLAKPNIQEDTLSPVQNIPHKAAAKATPMITFFQSRHISRHHFTPDTVASVKRSAAETDIIPQLPESVYVPSILLVDTLNTPSGDTIAYKGFNTVVLSQVCAFENMDEDSKSLYKGSFLAALVVSALESEWLEENFYSITYDVNPGNESYLYSDGTSTVGIMVYRAYSGTDVAAEDQTLGGLGFICTYTTPTSSSERLWYVPTKTQDAMAFCREILSYTEAEFIEMHGEYEVVMDKYYVMREKLQEYGFTFDE